MTRQDKLAAFGIPATLAILSLIAGLIVLATRPSGTGAGRAGVSSKADRQKWLIQSVPPPKTGFGKATATGDALMEALAGMESRHARGKPDVRRGSVLYFDWDTGEQREWFTRDNEVHVQALEEFKE